MVQKPSIINRGRIVSLFMRWAVFCAVVSGLASVSVARAAETFQFLGVAVTPHVQDYIATNDVNIRAKPLRKSKKLGQLKKSQRVTSVGRTDDKWIALRADGKDIGFVVETYLFGVLDGTLEKPLAGVLQKVGHPDCRYSIVFQGKSAAEGQLFEIADYEVAWRCQNGDASADFTTPMFMTEGPYKRSKKPSYQITVDIVDVIGDLDEVISTTVFYDHIGKKVTFDSVSEKRFEGIPDITESEASSLPAALKACVEMTYHAWTKPLWAVLLKAP